MRFSFNQQAHQPTLRLPILSGAAVDVSNNTTGSNVSTEQFSNFPTQRTVQWLYTIAPTVTRSGLRDAIGRDRDPSVGGSSGPENNYILDGVNTTDPAFGGSGANLPFEFVQEVEIKTGAYGAEYGKSTGGIFNVITKSGGNEFHGDVFGYFTTKGLVRDSEATSRSPVRRRTASPKSTLVLTSVVQSRKTSSGSLEHSTHRSARTISSRRRSTESENKITTPVLLGQDHVGHQSQAHVHVLDLW